MENVDMDFSELATITIKADAVETMTTVKPGGCVNGVSAASHQRRKFLQTPEC